MEKLNGKQAEQLVRAFSALEQGRAAEAVAIYTRLINTRKLPPELLARALLNRGLAFQRLQQQDAAITDYDAALAIDALSVRARVTALYNRALAWRAKGDAGRAMEDLTAALHMDPGFAPAYFARGNILHERGLYYLALADYDQALANGHPQKYRVHYARALLFSALNSPARTKEALYAALKEKPDFRPARQRLAAILQGRLPKTRLFADLLKKRPAKRITARIIPAAGSGAAETNVRTASVMIVGAPVLNVRKAPQRMAATPPTPEGRMLAAAQMQAQGQAERQQAGLQARQQAQHKPWRVASTQALPPAPAAATGDAATGDAAATPHAASPDGQAAAGRAPAPLPRQRPAALYTASVDSTAAVAASGPQQEPTHERASQQQFTGWAIQLASQRSEEAARAYWRKVRGKVRRHVRAGQMAVMRAELPGRGIFYRVRLVGFANRARAQRLCRGLKRGRIACLVVRADG